SADQPETAGGRKRAVVAVPGMGVQGIGPFTAFAGGAPAHHLFTRTTADGIVIRAYRSDPPPLPKPAAPATSTSTSVTSKSGPQSAPSCIAGSPPPVEPPRAPSTGNQGGPSAHVSAEPPCAQPPMPVPCTPTPTLLAELSNAAAVSQGFASLGDTPTDPVTRLSDGFFGVVEGSPATWVAVRT